MYDDIFALVFIKISGWSISCHVFDDILKEIRSVVYDRPNARIFYDFYEKPNNSETVEISIILEGNTKISVYYKNKKFAGVEVDDLETLPKAMAYLSEFIGSAIATCYNDQIIKQRKLEE